MRGISKSTQGAMNNANALFGSRNAAGRAYRAGAKGKQGMAAHKAGMKSAGLS